MTIFMTKKTFICIIFIDPAILWDICFTFHSKTFVFYGNNIVRNIPINLSKKPSILGSFGRKLIPWSFLDYKITNLNKGVITLDGIFIYDGVTNMDLFKLIWFDELFLLQIMPNYTILMLIKNKILIIINFLKINKYILRKIT